MAYYNRPKRPPGAVIIRGTGPKNRPPVKRRIPWRPKEDKPEASKPTETDS